MSREVAPPAVKKTGIQNSLGLAASLFLAIGVIFSVGLTFSGAVLTGVSWDEHFHLQMVGTWAESGWYARFDVLRDYDFQNDNGSLYVYGPVTSLFLHAVAVIGGVETLGSASLSSEAYVARHIGTALIALVGSAAVAGLVWVATNSKAWSALGFIVVSLFPLWLGHAMFNLKDVPVASGYTLATLGYALLAGSNSHRSRIRFFGIFSLVSGLLVGVGTRPGMWVPLVGTSIIAGLLMVLVRNQETRQVFRYATDSIIGMTTAYLVLALVYPKLFLSPTRLLLSALGSTSYPWSGSMLVAGQWLTTPPPWYYAPVLFLAQVPIFILVLLVIGLILSVKSLELKSFRPLRGRPANFFLVAILLGSQAFSLLSYAVFTEANLYDGIRQLLFVVPALAGLSVLAAHYTARSLGLVVPSIIMAVGLFFTSWAHVSLFPFNYVYVNPVASVNGVDGVWMADYWATSGRYLVPLLPEGSLIGCDYWSEDRAFEPCESKPQYSPFWSFLGQQNVAEVGVGDTNWLLVRPNRGEFGPPGECDLYDSVTRQLWGKTVTMGWIGLCPVPEGGLAP